MSEGEDVGLSILSTLNKFDETLAGLVLSISKFNPSVKLAQELNERNRDLYKSVDELIEHQETGKQIGELQKKYFELNSVTQEAILTLAECRRELRDLSTLEHQSENDVGINAEQTTSQNLQGVDVELILKYASRLSKFSSVPPMIDSSFIGPANFVWPSEDALRKGMLAIASLNADELTHCEENDEGAKPSTAEDGAQGSPTTGTRNRGSFSFGSSERERLGEEEPEIQTVNLDLFDEDDEDI